MTEPIVVTLDVRKMVARERHPTIFSRFDALKPGDTLRLVNDHDPTLLRSQLFAERPDMFTWKREKQGPTEWIISIQKIAGKSEEQVKGEKQGEAGNLITFDLARVPSALQNDEMRTRRKEMLPLTQPLRDEHKELLPHIELLRTVADAIGEAPIASLQRSVDEAYAFLTHHLIPHAQAEERALYPVVGRLMGAPAATATMSRDHVEVGRLTVELGALRSHLVDASVGKSQEKALRRVLYSLFAVVTVHFAKEEEIYLPILDTGLTSEEAHRMFEAMERAAQEAK